MRVDGNLVTWERDTIGDDMRALRKRLGKWTQADLATRGGWALSTVQRWEAGVCVPSPMARRVLEKLAGEVEKNHG